MSKQFFAIAVGVLALCAITSVPARAYSWSTCDRYETYTENGYNLYSDEWGASSGQCVYANSSTNWWSVANFPSGSGVQAYPDSEISLGNVNLSSLSSVNSSFNFSVPNAPWYDAAYDLWTNGNVDEVMVWEDWNGNGPIASSYSCNQLGVGGCPFATNVTIDGVAYDVFQGNTGHNVVSFLRISKTTSGSVNLLNLMNWLASQGKLDSQTFSTADFGFEIGDTNGSQTFTLNSFSVETNNGGGGGGCTSTGITPYISVNGGSSWSEVTTTTVSSTSTLVDLGPQPISGGSWSWSGPNGYSSTSREIDDIPLSTGSNAYTATYTNSGGCKSTETFTITVSGGGGTQTQITPYIQVNGGAWQQTASTSVTSTSSTVNLGPQPVSGGSWKWSGPNGYSSTSRQINGIPLSAGTNTYTATYTNSSGVVSTQVFTITAP
ncbi:MAG: hypothetical protein WAN35_04570 [Terracidiphilus sp.]